MFTYDPLDLTQSAVSNHKNLSRFMFWATVYGGLSLYNWTCSLWPVDI